MPTKTLSTKIVSQTIGSFMRWSPSRAARVGSCRTVAVVGDAASRRRSRRRSRGRTPPSPGHQRHQVDDVLGVEPRGRAGHLAGTFAPPQTWALPIAHHLAGLRRPRRCRRTRRPGRPRPSRASSARPSRAVTSSGACRPGTAAVVISASAAAMYGASRSRCRCGAVLGHLAGVAAGALQGLELQLDRTARPSTRISSAAAARTSYALTTAPSRLAVAIACRPATPAPSTTHLGGRDGAGGGHVQREEPAQPAGGDDRAAVAGDQRLRRQRVHRLGPGDPRHQLHRERRDRRSRAGRRPASRRLVRPAGTRRSRCRPAAGARRSASSGLHRDAPRRRRASGVLGDLAPASAYSSSACSAPRPAPGSTATS